VANQKPRPRGRPKVPEERQRRHLISVRTTQSFKEDLEAAAARSGRSLAQEAELRLERSFEQQTIMKEILAASKREMIESFGGADHYQIAKIFNAIRAQVERETGKSWREDMGTLDLLIDRVSRFLVDFGPAGSHKQRADVDDWAGLVAEFLRRQDTSSET
jgi:hypothetical protein